MRTPTSEHTQHTAPTAPAEAENGGARAPARLETVGPRYQMLSYLGHGGMGVVYRVRDRLTRNVVALKRLMGTVDPFPRHSSECLTSMFSRAAGAGVFGAGGGATPTFRVREEHSRLGLASEFRLLASLRHPNIIGVLDYGFGVDRRPYFTMELVEGGRTLTQAAAALSSQRRLDLLLQVLEALCFLHRRGVVHRDLKPSNVLVDERVRVLDFGIAAPRGREATRAGTLSYMAPEVLRGGPSEPAADLYALGILAFQLFAGVHPYDSVEPSSLAIAAAVPDPDWSRVAASPAVCEAIRCLLEPNPKDRFASAEEAIEALTRAGNLVRLRERHDTRESRLRSAELVDREAEREALGGALSRLFAGQGGVWLLEGESGIGKTRLLDEVRVVALVLGAKVIRGQASSGPSAAFSLWMEPLRNLVLGEPVEEELASLLATLVPDIGALLGRAIDPAPVNAQTIRAQLLAAIAELVSGQTAPLLLLLEDLHWAGESLDVLRRLAPALGDRPVLVLGTYRGDEAPGLAATVPGARQLELGPLEPKDVASLTRSLLGSDVQDDRGLLELLESHARGNAFFVIEVLRALAEEAGSLEQVANQAIPAGLVAQGVDSVVRHRLGRIPTSLERWFAWSAVVGRGIDLRLVKDEFGAPLVAQALAVGAELAILEVSDAGWRFAHDKFREALLARSSQPRAAALHASVAAAIERVHGGDPAWAAPLAEHYHQAGLPEKELQFSAIAGQGALERGAYAEASRLLARALELVERASTPNPEQHLQLLLLKGSLLTATMSWSTGEAKAVYERAVELARASGQHQLVGPPLHGLAMFVMGRGELLEGDELAKNLVRLADESGDAIGRIQGLMVRAASGTWLGRHREAKALHQELFDLYQPEQLPLHVSRYGWHPWLVAAVTQAVSTCLCGDPEGAVAIHRKALALAQRTGNPFNLTIAHQTSAWVHYLRREARETLAHADALTQLAGEHGFPMFALLGETFGGWVDALAGDREQGLARVRSAWARWDALDLRWAKTFLALHHGEVSLVCGELAEAEALLTEAVETAFGSDERCYHAELQRLRGEVLLARGDGPRAREEHSAAAALARRQGAQLFEMRALSSLIRAGETNESVRLRLAELSSGRCELPAEPRV